MRLQLTRFVNKVQFLLISFLCRSLGVEPSNSFLWYNDCQYTAQMVLPAKNVAFPTIRIYEMKKISLYTGMFTESNEQLLQNLVEFMP